MTSINKFMIRAIELSINSASGTGGPFGCVVVKDEKIIAEGSNKVTFSNDPTAHAEIVAIREACRKLNTFIKPAWVRPNGNNLDSIKKVKFLGKSKKIAAALIAELEG